MNKIEHIGIAVKSLEASEKIYRKILGVGSYKAEEVKTEQVQTLFFRTGDSKIELLEATSPDSTIRRFIDKKGEGIHHIAFEVNDIEAEMRRLQAEGFVLLNDVPKPGADNKLVCFIHPKDAGGVLIELCQELKERNERI